MRATRYYHTDQYNSLLYFNDIDEVDYYLDVIEQDDEPELVSARDAWQAQNRACYLVSENDSNEPFAGLYSRNLDEPVA